MPRKLIARFLLAILLSPLAAAGQGQESDRSANPAKKPPAPSPTPTPRPTPAPGPSAEDLQRAANQGRSDGQADGYREGLHTGREEGPRRGRYEGERNGYDRCFDEEARNAFESGFRLGLTEGARRGIAEGVDNGSREGARRGDDEGRRDGFADARRAALQSQAAPGRALGLQQADGQATEIAARATQDGTAAGEQEAAERARSEAYPRGREEYRQAQFALRPRLTESFSLARETGRPISRILPAQPLFDAWPLSPGPAPETVWLHHAGSQDNSAPSPEKSSPAFTNRRTPPSFPTPEEQRAYNQAYRLAYNESWRRAYQEEFRRSYRAEYNYAYTRGCDRARRQDFSYKYADGQQRGLAEGHRREYEPNYSAAFEETRRRLYRQAFDETLAAELPRAKQNAFEEARQAAFEERAREIYARAFGLAKEQKYAAAWPTFQAQEFQRGQRDEAEDFARRPLRLLQLQVSETIPDGLYEPGEELRLNLSIRNFSPDSVKPGDFTIIATGGGDAVSGEAKINLGRDIRGLSANLIENALVFSLPESALSDAYTLSLRLFFKGQATDEDRVVLRADFSASLTLSGETRLAEGLPGELRVTVTNQSRLATPEDARVMLRAGASTIEWPVRERLIGALPPGESRTLAFPAIARGYEAEAMLPLDLRIESGARRLGRLTAVQKFAVRNDYQVAILSNLNDLREQGATRLRYEIVNNSSPATARSLQVRVSFLGDNAALFRLPGVNPQYLAPVGKGQRVRFAVPVQVEAANGGGLAQFEIFEEGRPVVTRQIRF